MPIRIAHPTDGRRPCWRRALPHARRRAGALLGAAIALTAILGCERAPMQPRARALASMTQAQAAFPSWRQGFDHGTEGWIDASTAGPEGWCGSIERRDRSSSSRGSGHAAVEQTTCNEFWATHGFSTSGPYSPGAGYSNDWPTGGYVTDLDIYLDPHGSPPTEFVYAVSFALLDEAPPENLRYLLIPVSASGDALDVVGHEVGEAGWYTFRMRFGSDAGQLSATFELRPRQGPVSFSVPMTMTAFTGQDLALFAASTVGTGYVWFVAIADGLQLLIDEHQVRRGA